VAIETKVEDFVSAPGLPKVLGWLRGFSRDQNQGSRIIYQNFDVISEDAGHLNMS
jgi:hypothetical protein